MQVDAAAMHADEQCEMRDDHERGHAEPERRWLHPAVHQRACERRRGDEIENDCEGGESGDGHASSVA